MFRQQQLINPCASLSRSFVWVRIYADMGHASECEGLFRAQLCACERTKRGKIFIRAEQLNSSTLLIPRLADSNHVSRTFVRANRMAKTNFGITFS